MSISMLWSKIPRLLLWLCGLAIIGTALYAPGQRVDLPSLITQTQDNLSTLRSALDIFHDDCGRYPFNAEGLTSLEKAQVPLLSTWRGPYIVKLKPDPWGRPYTYYTLDGGKSFSLRSSGPDRKDGTADDIVLNQHASLDSYKRNAVESNISYSLPGEGMAIK